MVTAKLFNRALRIILSNTNAEPYIDMDALINTDMAIIDARARSDFNTCLLSPGIPPFIRERAFSDEALQRPALNSHYRVRCDKFMPLTEIEIAIAAVLPNWTASSPQVRQDPKMVRVFASYTAGGKKRKHNETYFPIIEPPLSSTPDKSASQP